MQGYGRRSRLILIPLGVVTAIAVSACSLLDIDTPPSSIVIPGTDALITETPPSSLSATSASRRADANSPLSRWSLERVIKAAPRASNSQYQIGATSESGERSEASGYHFSTEDRSIRCSTGNNGANALACVSGAVSGARRDQRDTGKCEWRDDYVVIDANGAKEGACANSYPVLYRSRILPSGSSINIDRFACLADGDDLYCIESSSGEGFSITESGYTELRADERAPKPLLGMASSTVNQTPEEDRPRSVAPTR